MKTLRILLMMAALGLIALSCEKDKNFVQITSFEDQLAKAVNHYRVISGLNELAHNYDVLSREAKANAVAQANGTIKNNQELYDDMEQRWATVWDKLGINNVSNENYLSAVVNDPVDETNAAVVAAQLVDLWASDSIGELILKGDYTLQGPGEGKTSDGRTYVMHMLCKFEQ